MTADIYGVEDGVVIDNIVATVRYTGRLCAAALISRLIHCYHIPIFSSTCAAIALR